MIASLVRRIVRRRAASDFQLEELDGLFSAMQALGLETLPVEKFARRFSRRQRAQGYGLMRFDIHGNVERALHVAEALNARGMTGLFMVMHRHPASETIHGARGTWDALARIRDLGHEIGLHFDPFYLIRAHGDLYAGIGAALAELTAHGFAINAASVHHDVRPHIRECGLAGHDFFAEDFHPTRWNRSPPRDEEFLTSHVRRYSLAKIGQDFGLNYLAEPNFAVDGQLAADRQPSLLTDHRRQLRLTNLVTEDGTPAFLAAPEPCRIPPDFAHGIAAALYTRPFLTILHPQWYA